MFMDVVRWDCILIDPFERSDNKQNAEIKSRCSVNFSNFQRKSWGTAIAQWIRLRLPFCHPGFESQAHHLHFNQFIKLCNVEKTKINKNEAGIGPFKKS